MKIPPFIEGWLAEYKDHCPESANQAKEFIGKHARAVRYELEFAEVYSESNINRSDEDEAKRRWEYLRALGKCLNEIALCLTAIGRSSTISDETIKCKKLPLSVLILLVEGEMNVINKAFNFSYRAKVERKKQKKAERSETVALA